MAVLFHWEPGDETFVAYHDGLGEASILKEADGWPVMVAKFGILLPEWQAKENLLQIEGHDLQSYFNRIEEVFASIPSPFLPFPGRMWDASTLARYRK